MYKLIAQQGRARRGVFSTVHGDIQLPAFMNVGTGAAIKGSISSIDLKNELRCQVQVVGVAQHYLAANILQVQLG